jgi:hypothetical protein
MANVIGMHDALSADGGNCAIAIKIDSTLQTLEALDYPVPKAVPFSMPSQTPAVVAQSVPSPPAARASISADLQLYTTAMLSRNPDALEAAAGKIQILHTGKRCVRKRKCFERHRSQRHLLKVKLPIRGISS